MTEREALNITGLISLHWVEQQHRWQSNVSNGVQRKTFTSTKKREKDARLEIMEKARAWLLGSTKDEKSRIEDLWPEYISFVQQNKSTSAYMQHRKMGEDYILPVLGRLRLCNVTDAALEDVLYRAYKHGCLKKETVRPCPGKPLSKKTLTTIRAVETAFIKWCRKNGYTTYIPHDVDIPKDATVKERRILTEENLQTLFAVSTIQLRSHVVYDEFVNAYRLMVLLGLRPGECCALCVGSIDAKKQLTIAGSINQYGEYTKGKNANARRRFTVSDSAYAVFEAQLAWLRVNGYRMDADAPLFPTACGDQCKIYRRWKLYQQCNGITPAISAYELRHTFVSIVKTTMPEALLKQLVGHSASMDTFGTYGHKTASDDEETAAAMQQAFAPVLREEKP